MSPELQGPDPKSIKNLFNSIANRYDTANHIITLGLAKSWRKQLVDWSEVSEGSRVLDCATGTGDLAIEFKKAVGETGSVIGSDFCKSMLEKAPEKAKKENTEIVFELGDALSLNYPNNEFDITSMAYGIRNVAKAQKALYEMARVTKPGGYVMILETGETETPLLKNFVDIYFKHIVPRLGGFVSGNRSAYEYLQGSSQKFPSGDDFIDLMRSTDSYHKVEYRKLWVELVIFIKGKSY